MLRSEIIEEDLKNIVSDKNIDWQAFAGKTVLISGANGFLPAYMIETLLYANETVLNKKVKVIGLVRDRKKSIERFPHYSERDDFEIIEQDVSDPVNVEGNVDFIIHAASQASPRYFFADPVGTINANVLGTSNLLRLANEKHIQGFLFFSSGEVYGNVFDSKNVVNEDDFGIVNPLLIRNCYAESKRLGEAMCAGYFHQYGIPTKIVRPSHTYGPGFSFDDGRAFTSFVACVINNQNIVLKGDGRACRSFIYLADATRGYFTVLLKGESPQAYNVGNEYEICMLDLAKTIINASGKDALRVEFDTDSSVNISSASQHGLLSIEKLKTLGWRPRVQEDEGFSRTINYYNGLRKKIIAAL